MGDNKLIYEPLISVISVCYNAAEDLGKTINSVIRQTYDNIEYIIIDGGSQDGTIELIKRNSLHISKWISEPDGGIYDAMNKGIRLATGDWIIFMNAGDTFYYDGALHDVFCYDILDDTKIIYGDVLLDFGKLGTIKKRLYRISEEQSPFEICHQSVLTSTDVLKRIEYDTSYRICADCDSFYKIQKMGYKLQYVPVTISKFEVVEGVSSTKMVEAFKEHCRLKGENSKSLKYLIAECKVYIKSMLYTLLPSHIYNKMRFNSVKSRTVYK